MDGGPHEIAGMDDWAVAQEAVEAQPAPAREVRRLREMVRRDEGGPAVQAQLPALADIWDGLIFVGFVVLMLEISC